MKRMLIVILSVSLVDPVQAQLVVDRPRSGHRYYYRESFLIPSQLWDGSPFVVEADLVPPAKDFAHNSWFGLCIDDTEQRERYIFGAGNPSRLPDPATFGLLTVACARKPTELDWSKKPGWARTEGVLTVRVSWDGSTLIASRRLTDGTYETFSTVKPLADFNPVKIGINSEAFSGEGPIHGFACTAFRVLEGKGPAKSDPMDGIAPATWDLGRPNVSKFVEYPYPLVMEWWIPCEEPTAYDRGADAVIQIRAKTWIYGGRTAKVVWRTTDFDGKELAHGEIAMALVQKKNVFGSIVVPASALTKNGVYRLEAEASIDGKLIKKLFAQFAVLPPRVVEAHSFDPDSPWTINYLLNGSWNLSGRVGAKKLRMPYWSEDAFDKDYQLDPEMARRHGILLNGPYLMVHQRDLPEENEAEAKRIAGVFARLNAKYADLIRAQEVFNEPEAQMKGYTEMTAYCSMLGKIKRELKALGSPVKLIGTGPLHCDLDYLMRVALTGGRDSVDIITTHGYRSPCRPEFGYDEDVRAIKAIYGDDGRDIVCDEDTYFTYVSGERATSDDREVSMTAPTHTLNELDELTQGAYIQRKFLNQLMAGYTGVNQFNALDNHVIGYKSDYQRPGVVTFAAITWLMPHPKFVRRLTLATDHLWALEWTSDADTLRTFWSMDGLHEVTLHGRSLEVFDTFANLIGTGDRVTFVVGTAPVFVRGAHAEIVERKSAEALPVVVLKEDAPLSEKPYDATVLGHATGMKSAVVEVSVKNNSGKIAAFRVRPTFIGKDASSWGFEPSERTGEIASGEIRKFAFVPVSKDVGMPFDPVNPGINYTALWWTEGYQIGAIVSTAEEKRSFYNTRQLSLRGIPRLEAAVVDGGDADWGDVPWFRQLGNRRRNAGLGCFGWYSKYSFLPEFRFAWCKKGLRFFAKVLDERHDASQKGIDAWRTDSIQLGLTGHWAKPDHVNWPLLTFSLANKEVYLQRDTPKLKAGPIKEIEFASRRVEGSYEDVGTTYYEALIPWSILDMDSNETKTFGYSIIFNQSIGYWRQGWEGYFGPLGGQIVDPTCFGDLTICE